MKRHLFLKRYADDQHGSEDLGKGHGNIQCDMQSIFESAIVFWSNNFLQIAQ